VQPAQAPVIRWWQALDPPIYLISVLPGAAVWLLAGIEGRPLAAVAAATLAVILLQHAINVLNDVSDWRLGADIEKFHSWARFHHQDLRVAAAHGYVSLLAGGLLGLVLLAQAEKFWILAIAVPLVLLGYLYNAGPRPLAYTSLGEWVTGLCYGPGVFGCLWLLAGGGMTVELAAGSAAFMALAMSLLLSHQPAQVDTDRQAGKHTFAVRYGVAATRRTSLALFVGFLLALLVAVSQSGLSAISAITNLLCAVIVGGYSLRLQPVPRRILAGATVVLLATMLVELAMHIPGS
jgi:1,4-dihydroxy-2-naphthoate octaprenyltransferase